MATALKSHAAQARASAPRRVAIALAVIALGCNGCDRGDSRKEPTAARPDDEAAKPPEPKAAEPPKPKEAAPSAAEPLPRDGMVCRGEDTWVWPRDGKLAKSTLSIEPSLDGKLYESRMTGPGMRSVAPLSDPPVPAIDLPAGTILHKLLILGPATMLLVPDDGTKPVHVLREKAWTTIAVPQEIAAPQYSFVGATQLAGKLWLAYGSALLREGADGSLAKVSLGKGSVNGVLAVGDTIYAVTTGYEKDTTVWAITGEKPPRKVTALTSIYGVQSARLVANQHGYVAIGLHALGHRDDKLVILAPLAKPVEAGKGLTNLVAIDSHNRVWWERQDALVVRAADGQETIYPRSSEPLFAEAASVGVRCYELGDGFATLPPPAPERTGRLVVDVTGEGTAGAPFEACDGPSAGGGPTPCASKSPRISATLDKDGHWAGTTPMGSYSISVQVDGRWLTPDYLGGGNSICHVKEGSDCTLKAKTK